jgi:hypothetical protein
LREEPALQGLGSQTNPAVSVGYANDDDGECAFEYAINDYL